MSGAGDESNPFVEIASESKPSLVLAAHVRCDDAGRNFLFPVCRNPTDADWTWFYAATNVAAAGKPIQIKLQPIL
jgi:hypothetical protein